MKVIITGSRDFCDYALVKDKCERILRDKKEGEIEVVCGMCKGVDMLGKRLAEEKGWRIKKIRAHPKIFGRSAGIIRDHEMADYADALIVFWDGKKGCSVTYSIVSKARKRGLYVRVILIYSVSLQTKNHFQ